MSSLFNNVRINNIYHDLKDLEQVVNGLVTGGGGTISENLDMNGYNLTDTGAIQFSNTGTLTVNEDSQLTFNDAVINGGVQNPMSADLDCGTHNIANLRYLNMNDSANSEQYYVLLEDGTLAVENTSNSDDFQQFISINRGGGGYNHSTNFYQFGLEDVASVAFYNLAENPATLTTTTTGDALTFNGSVMVTAANIEDYVSGGGGGWVSTATSNLDMANYEINSLSSIDFGSGKDVGVDSANNLIYKQSLVVTRSQLQPTYSIADGASILMANNSVATSPVLTIANSDMSFSGSFQFELTMNHYTFDENNSYYIGIGVKTHTTNQVVFSGGAMVLFDSSAFTNTDNGDGSFGLAGTTITFDASTATGTGGLYANNLGSPLSTDEDYDFFAILSSQTGDDDCACDDFTLVLTAMNSDVYGNLDIGDNSLVLNNKLLANVGGSLVWDGTKTLLTNADGYFKAGATALNMGNYQITNALWYGLYNSGNPSLPHTIAISGGKIQLDGYDAVTSNNIGGYCGWDNGVAQTTISMAGEQLQGVDEIAFSNTKILTTSGNQLTYDGNVVLTQNDPVANANPWYKFTGIVNSTSTLTMDVSVTLTDSSFYFSGVIQSLFCCMKFDSFVYRTETEYAVDTPNIQTIADIDGNLLEDVTITTDGSTTITLTLTSQTVAPSYDSITILYQLVQCDFQSP